jgi:Conserved protein/domain typically associated with flavoprotein oxygenases, DIM6/NTAB family
MEQFKTVNPSELSENVFNLIGDEWMLIGASKPDGTFNMMTASWGQMGIMWGAPSVTCLIRKTRLTYEYTEASPTAAFSFFGDDCRDQLGRLGSKSGREIDKMRDSGLTPVVEDGTVWFKEARLVIFGRKFYAHDLIPAQFQIPGLCDSIYPEKNYHRVYTYAIEKIIIKDR